MKNGVDRALTAASVLAGLALVAAFVAGLASGPGSDYGSPAVDGNDAGAASGESGAEPAAAPAEPEPPAPERSSLPEPPPDASPLPPPLADPPTAFEGSAKVEILNGAGRAGFARDATVRLRELGHDVVSYGNADRFDHASSVVLDRGGPPGAARAVADALGIADVRAEAAPELALDATVILGVDWVLPPPPRETPTGLRGLFERIFGPDEG
ncbi:MAG TPA: LytR C-terminal domain-containing protein [Longimicrobiales bacterium]|nr:LytR C-terminal domain-containing protein [Longimicrobiales bacterium]